MVIKTLIHAVILASIINSCYLVGVPLLADVYTDVLSTLQSGAMRMPSNLGHLGPLGGGLDNPAAIFAGWSLDEFVTLTKLEVSLALYRLQ